MNEQTNERKIVDVFQNYRNDETQQCVALFIRKWRLIPYRLG